MRAWENARNKYCTNGKLADLLSTEKNRQSLNRDREERQCILFDTAECKTVEGINHGKVQECGACFRGELMDGPS